ncbi:hypothetical protein DFH07DRAFT_765651 [Mycena maculata]|uniref:Uncharacterized protein n=1 Tax=Mycena maculata TaxID=230809 RepID=A0AAD7K6I9_9AGAR|nr:hypothetical protein DFH07DRAFT_765651 [Mycena maculata]
MVCPSKISVNATTATANRTVGTSAARTQIPLSANPSVSSPVVSSNTSATASTLHNSRTPLGNGFFRTLAEKLVSNIKLSLLPGNTFYPVKELWTQKPHGRNGEGPDVRHSTPTLQVANERDVLALDTEEHGFTLLPSSNPALAYLENHSHSVSAACTQTF